jgi:hypothetical protein
MTPLGQLAGLTRFKNQSYAKRTQLAFARCLKIRIRSGIVLLRRGPEVQHQRWHELHECRLLR